MNVDCGFSNVNSTVVSLTALASFKLVKSNSPSVFLASLNVNATSFAVNLVSSENTTSSLMFTVQVNLSALIV